MPSASGGAQRKTDLAAVRDAIRAKHQVSVTIHPMDLSDGKNAKRLVAACPDADILVNNAGAIPGGAIDAVDEERWRQAWDLKVFGYINMCRRNVRADEGAQAWRDHQCDWRGR